MAGWPQDWQKRTLRAMDIPVTQWAIDVLTAWQRSTPTMPWTNNPLGMPYRPYGQNRALDTPYGMFSSINLFAKAMGKFALTKPGIQLVNTLANASSLGSAWRDIHTLNWPAVKTETDYPHMLLDMVEESYRSKLSVKDKTERKSAGTQQAHPSIHEGVRQQAAALSHAAKSFSDGRQAIQGIVRRLG